LYVPYRCVQVEESSFSLIECPRKSERPCRGPPGPLPCILVLANWHFWRHFFPNPPTQSFTPTQKKNCCPCKFQKYTWNFGWRSRWEVVGSGCTPGHHDFSFLLRLFMKKKITRQWQLQLFHDAGTAYWTGVVCFYLLNCYTCFNGGACNSMFEMFPPTIEDYLPLHEHLLPYIPGDNNYVFFVLNYMN